MSYVKNRLDMQIWTGAWRYVCAMLDDHLVSIRCRQYVPFIPQGQPLLALSQTNLTEILTKIPVCAQECSAKEFPAAECQLANITNCLCANSTLQREVAICVLETCSIADQGVTLTIIQNHICKGVPQPSRSGEIIRDIIIITALTYPFIFLRFVSRVMVAHKIWWDDFAVILAAILMIPMIFFGIFNASHGFGKHFWNIPPRNIQNLRLLYYISQMVYTIVINLARLSILCLYLRVFVDERFRFLTKIALGVILCQILSFLFVVAFQCIPVQSIWDTTVKGKCLNPQALAYTAAALGIVEDIAIILLPIRELLRLDLNMRKKGAVLFMFGLGSFACVTSIIRLRFIISFGNSIDQTWDNCDVVIWSVAETFTAVICACLMCTRPLITKFLPKLLSQTNGNAKQTENPSWGQVVSSRLRSGSKGMERLNGNDRGVNQTHSTVRSSVFEISGGSTIELDDIPTTVGMT